MNKYRKAVIEGRLLTSITNKITRYIKAVTRRIDLLLAIPEINRISKSISVEQDKILFVTTRGSYNCNPRAIADEIIRQGLPWKLVWVIRDRDQNNLKQYPKELTLVKRGSLEFYEEAASSKIWIDNSVSLSYLNVKKKPEQVLFQVWHGSIGLKRFDTNSNTKWIKKAKVSANQTDYCVTNSVFENELFENTYWNKPEKLMYGHARNDILLTDNKGQQKKITDKVRAELKVPEDYHVALYAPTYRDSGSLVMYDIDYSKVIEALQKRFGGNWCLLRRLHFEVVKNIRNTNQVIPRNVIEASDYNDIQDIMLIADVGITDYSSWICDYVLTRKPAFIYATDLKDYNQERGFCYPLHTTPFPIAENNDELINNILNFEEDSYVQKCDLFIKSKECIDDGHAAERMVKKMKEIIGGEK